MKHVKLFEDFVFEAVDKYSTIDYAKKAAKDIYDWKMKHISTAEKAIKILPELLDKYAPNIFDSEFGFGFRGNVAVVFLKTQKPVDKWRIDSSFVNKLENDPAFSKYFDMANMTMTTDDAKNFSWAFRIKS